MKRLVQISLTGLEHTILSSSRVCRVQSILVQDGGRPPCLAKKGEISHTNAHKQECIALMLHNCYLVHGGEWQPIVPIYSQVYISGLPAGVVRNVQDLISETASIATLPLDRPTNLVCQLMPWRRYVFHHLVFCHILTGRLHVGKKVVAVVPVVGRKQDVRMVCLMGFGTPGCANGA